MSEVGKSAGDRVAHQFIGGAQKSRRESRKSEVGDGSCSRQFIGEAQKLRSECRKSTGDRLARQFMGGTLGMSGSNFLIDIFLMNDSRSCRRPGQALRYTPGACAPRAEAELALRIAAINSANEENLFAQNSFSYTD